MNKIIFYLFTAIFPLLVLAQDSLPVTQNVQVEVLTSELQKNSKAQNLVLSITCNSFTAGQKLVLSLKNMEGIFVPVEANRDETSIWLQNAESAHENEIILAWTQSEDENGLQLSPGAWTPPFRLDLKIQVSLSNLKDMPDVSETQLEVLVSDGNSQSLAAATGRGNQISLKNSRE